MDAVIEVLRPVVFGDYILYGIFFLALISNGLIPEKSQNARWVMTVVLLCSVLLKMRIQNFLGIEPFFRDFLVMMLAIGQGVLPYIGAALIRIRGRKGRASIPLAIFTGIVGTLYLLIFFFAPDMVR